MLCCLRKDEYELDEEGKNKKQKGKRKNDNKTVDKSKVNGEGGINQVIEPPVEIKVTEAVEAENQPKLLSEKAGNQEDSEIKGGDSNDLPEDKGDDSHPPKGNPQFASQLSFTSQISLREDIYRSREKFFTTGYPLNLDEYLSQADRRSISSTDERFAIHQSKIRSLNRPSKYSAIPKVTHEDEMSAEEMKAVVDRLESVAMRLESLATTGPKPAAGGAAPVVSSGPAAPFVVAFDDILSGNFAKFLELSNKIGGDVQTQDDAMHFEECMFCELYVTIYQSIQIVFKASQPIIYFVQNNDIRRIATTNKVNMVNAAFKATRDFLAVASKSKKPAPNDLPAILKPISDQIAAIQQFREDNRRSKQFNHISGISESIPALGWVAVEPTPGPYVKDMQDAGMFYTNRVLKDFKGVDEDQCEWTKKWNGTLTEMMAYIKQYHTTGVTWNPQGGDAKSAVSQSGSTAAPPPPPPGGAPPPPPPPPIEAPAPAAPSGGDDGQAARAQLFADLNKGAGVTSGLKKVTDDMKTHKNPTLRAQTGSSGPAMRTGPAPFKATNNMAPKPFAKPTKAPEVKPPVFKLDGKKWLVEHQDGNRNILIDNTELKQTVYIYKCLNSVITVKGKVNSIIVDSSKKVGVVFEDVVSSVEFVNSQSVQAQVTGKCPTVSIDKTDGCMVYLSKDSLQAEIVTAKSSEMNILVPNPKDEGDFAKIVTAISSEMNILVPNPKDEGDFIEFPLPEQFKSTWDGKKFQTGSTESI